MKNILITGGMGFIGSNLIKELQNDNYNLIVIDNEKYGINSLLNENNFKYKYYKGNLLNENLLNEIFENEKIDIIVHLASEISVYESIEFDKINFYNENNVISTINLLKYSVMYNIKHFIFSSSCSVYGSSKINNKEETILNPENPYAITKKHCEDYINYFSNKYKLKTNILRLSNVYGKNQVLERPYSSCIINFVNNIKNDKECMVYGSGNQERDFINVIDVCRFIKFSITNKLVGIFNISSGINYSINKVLDEIQKRYKKLSVIIYNKKRNGDLDKLEICNLKMLNTGFKLKYKTLKEGLKIF